MIIYLLDKHKVFQWYFDSIKIPQILLSIHKGSKSTAKDDVINQHFEQQAQSH